jgi:hypothetical protein
MAITGKSLRIFSAVEALRAGHADVRQALLPLFQPDIAKFHGRLFDPKLLADEINREYRLNITADIVSEMVPLFEAEGWITRLPTATSDELAFRVTCELSEPPLAAIEEFKARAAELGQEFRSFIEELSPLGSVNKTDSALVDDLVDWLVSIDVFSEQELRTARKVTRQGTRLVYEVVTVDNQRATDENYLCARFVDHLLASDSPFIPFLIELASVGLITEVVRDFQKPTTSVERTDLVVYFDAPVGLDFLGLSGTAAQENIRTIASRVVALGGNLRIFRVSIQEMQNSLRALLDRNPADRDGPTAQAMRRGEVHEAFVRQAINNPDRLFRELGVGIVDQTEDAFPNEHRFFSSGDIQDLYAEVHWVQDDTPRYHDAFAAALVLRKRGATRSNDLFNVRHVLVTKNPYFSPVARRVALSKHYIGPAHLGPVVHQRQLATAVWLRAGLAAPDTELPRQYILAACRRVLTVHKNLIERVRFEARSLSSVKREQLELLLTEGRSTQVLLDKTLGSANVIDAGNVEHLVEEMRKSVAAEAFAEADAQVQTAKKVAAQQQRKMKAAAAEQALAHSQLQAELSREASKTTKVANALVGRVNSSLRRRRIAVAALGVLFVIAAEALPIFLANSSGLPVSGGLLLLGLALHFSGVLKKRIFQPVGRWLALRTLQSRLGAAALSIEDLPYELDYKQGTFSPILGQILLKD